MNDTKGLVDDGNHDTALSIPTGFVWDTYPQQQSKVSNSGKWEEKKTHPSEIPHNTYTFRSVHNGNHNGAVRSFSLYQDCNYCNLYADLIDMLLYSLNMVTQTNS